MGISTRPAASVSEFIDLSEIAVLGQPAMLVTQVEHQEGCVCAECANGEDDKSEATIVTPTAAPGIPEVMADVPGDGNTTATLAVGGFADGVLEVVGDRDWYAVTLTAGQTYAFTLSTTAPQPYDTFLRLFNSGGTELRSDDDAGPGTDSRIVFTATSSGTYYISAGSYLDGQVGNYRIGLGLQSAIPVYTNDQIANQLTQGYWGAPGFGDASRHYNVAVGGTITYNLSALTPAAQAVARDALALWSDATGLVFSEIAGTANMRFIDGPEDAANGNLTSAFASSTVNSNGHIVNSVINVGANWSGGPGGGVNSYFFQTYIHEIGHALGLGHSGNYNSTADYGVDNDYQNDSWITSVMSYFDQNENSYFAAQNFSRFYVVTPMVADVIAATTLYGTTLTTRTTDTVYGFGSTSDRNFHNAATFPTVAFAIVDHGGVDTLNYSQFNGIQRIDLNEEAFSNVNGGTGNLTIARGTVIENAIGGGGIDVIIGNNANNVIQLQFGGNDVVSGNGGDDGFFFGGAFDQFDSVNGGSGYDQIGLHGFYTDLQLGANSTVGVEAIVMLTTNDTRFGTTTFFAGYTITTVDANVLAGQVLTFQANALLAGENFTLNGALEQDGSFLTFGGLGTENITGGAGNDGFYFGTGRLNAADRLIGGAGTDQLGLQGDFSAGLSLGAVQLTSIEFIVLMSATDTRFGGSGDVGQNYSYTLSTDNANVAGGQTMTIQGNVLRSGEVLTFNGSNELDGRFEIYSGAGADTLIGGQQGDEIYGGAGVDRIEGRGGADVLWGDAGNDFFVYRSTTDSTLTARDQIRDFTTGDRIDLTGVDGNALAGGTQAFVLIGGPTFTGAGQLRIIQTGNNALVEGDTNGDGTADFSISVTVADGHQLTSMDFVGLGGSAAEPLALIDDGTYQAPVWEEVGPDPYFGLDALFSRDFSIA